MNQDLPDGVLDQAFHWAVVLGSGVAGQSVHKAFDAWLDESPMHYVAWRRIQVIEQEFVSARALGPDGHQVLKKVEVKRRCKLSLSGVVSVLVLIGLLHIAPVQLPWQAQYITTAGEFRYLELPGGGLVHLNGSTSLDIEQRESGAVLLLHQGEIQVDSSAAPDHSKPRVHTPEGEFIPIGTRFVVGHGSDGTRLSVISGAVMLNPGSASGFHVNAGEHWNVHDGQALPLPEPALTTGAWMDGFAEADNARLGDLLDLLGQHYRGWLSYDDSAAELRVTGLFRLDDTDGALRAIEKSLPVSVERRAGIWMRVRFHAE